MNKKRLDELLAKVCGLGHLTWIDLAELRNLQQERIAELEAEVAEVKREQSDKACPLVHCRCGACGVAIHDDGGCGCKDNRRHGIVVHEADRITKLEAMVRRCYVVLQRVMDMHTSHYGKIAEHVADVHSAIAEATKPAVAQADNADLVLMPRELTEENGAKAMLIGQFVEFQGHVAITVSWSTIEKLYARAVKHLAKEAR